MLIAWQSLSPDSRSDEYYEAGLQSSFQRPLSLARSTAAQFSAVNLRERDSISIRETAETLSGMTIQHLGEETRFRSRDRTSSAIAMPVLSPPAGSRRLH